MVRDIELHGFFLTADEWSALDVGTRATLLGLSRGTREGDGSSGSPVDAGHRRARRAPRIR